jgi:ABC-type multidrug transport system fused ATPase/permease subunit
VTATSLTSAGAEAPTARPRFERLRRSLSMVGAMVRLHPRPFAIAVTGAAIFGLCTVLSSVAVSWLIDNVITPRFDEGHVARSAVVTGVTFILVVGVVRSAAVVMRRVFASITQFRVAATLSRGVVDRLVRQPISWHQRRPDGDLVGRAGVDTDAAINVLAPIPFATGTILMIVISSVWLLVTDPVLGALAIVMFPLLIGANVVYQRSVEEHFDRAQHELGRLSAAVHESFEGVQLVKAYGAEQRETERLSTIAGRLRDARVKAVVLRGTFEAVLDVLPSLTNVALVVVGAMRVQSGDMTVGELAGIVYLFTLLVFPLRLVGYVFADVPHSLSGWDRVRQVLDEPVEADPSRAITVAPVDSGIELVDVMFTFPGDDHAVLSDVDLRVPSGRIVALVGPTGAGKSTLIELAGGLIGPDRGAVAATAGARAIVFQEAFLFGGTIRDNVVVGAATSDHDVWAALRMAQAERFVADLPAGLDTVVGERGVSLSGGQRQRVALARALVRHPALLLLDDTTSALDPSTERAVLGNLRGALAGTTVLMVASRPSTIALADDVVYLERGTVIDHGTHDELMARRPAYRRLLQAFETDRVERVVHASAHGVDGGD